MKICGVIAEYNPLHLGHVHHLHLARQISGADALIVVMSGPFVQRGEPALADPLLRAQWAVGAGADLVLELPAAYACHGAQLFARGAVGLLDGLGCVESFCFGCETPALDLLLPAARLLMDEPEPLKARLRYELARGEAYPRARQLALAHILGESAIPLMTQANNVLALEYLQACLYLDSHLRPLPVARTGDGYRQQQIEGPLPSATGIRAALYAGQVPSGLPERVARDLAAARLLFPEALSSLVRWRLMTASDDALSDLPDMAEGLHLRLKRAARENSGYEQIAQAALTKRYSMPRIKRAMLHSLLEINQADTDRLRRDLPLFVRPLAMGECGGRILSLISRTSALPLIAHPARYRPQPDTSIGRLWAVNQRAWSLYALLSGRADGWAYQARLTPQPSWPAP